jgi:hypothetical protein
LWNRGEVEIVDGLGNVLQSFKIHRPSDIHIVHSKLVVRNNHGIWMADPSSSQVWKILNAGGSETNFERILIESKLNDTFMMYWLDQQDKASALK